VDLAKIKAILIAQNKQIKQLARGIKSLLIGVKMGSRNRRLRRLMREASPQGYPQNHDFIDKAWETRMSHLSDPNRLEFTDEDGGAVYDQEAVERAHRDYYDFAEGQIMDVIRGDRTARQINNLRGRATRKKRKKK
jgi:hypothetical protein